MDSGYFSEEIVEVIENTEYQYVIKAKHYHNMVDNAYKRPIKIWKPTVMKSKQCFAV